MGIIYSAIKNIEPILYYTDPSTIPSIKNNFDNNIQVDNTLAQDDVTVESVINPISEIIFPKFYSSRSNNSSKNTNSFKDNSFKDNSFKDNSSRSNINSSKNTNSFNDKYSGKYLRERILKLLTINLGWKEGKEFNLGEEIRSANSKIGAKNSLHKTGNAVDMTASELSYNEIKRALVNNKEIRDYFKKNNLGIIDESTPEKRKKHSWVSTGNHFHIGSDKLALKTWREWLKEANYAKSGTSLIYTPIKEDISENNKYDLYFLIPSYFYTQPKLNITYPEVKIETIPDIKSAIKKVKFISSGKQSKLYLQNTKLYLQNIELNNNEDNILNFLNRIVEWESAGNPKAIGPKTRSGDRAYGLYQIMWNNVKRYSKYSKLEFLNDVNELKRVAEILATENWNSLTNKDKEAIKRKGLTIDLTQGALWFSGLGGLRAYLNGEDRSDGSITVSQYINRLK